MRSLPSGTVTFLFTDIEGSTKLAQQYPDAMPTLLARHHEILRQCINAQNGYVFQIIGDAFCVAFSSAIQAVHAALDAQGCLQIEEWSPAPIKVRMGIHTGTAQLKEDGQYSGYATLALTQRVMSAGHGGQILLSGATRELIRDSLPANVELFDFGEKRLKDLLRPEHLYQLNAAGLPSTFPPLKTLDSFPNNLPIQLTSFIGREKEITEVKQELSEHRLVTLIGSGGTGKTRLSLQAAAELLEKFDHGVWFVELAPITDPELILSTIMSTIGISEQPGIPSLDTLKEYLRAKRTLIVLDNCEHLVSASAQLVNILLNAALGLKVLASSREALGIRGEVSYLVPSLAVPDLKHLPAIEQLSQYEAVRLFVDRALLVAPHFVVDKDNSPFIAQICYRLDGIPLAIELAAARVKMMTVEQISTRLNDRFRLLTGGARTALPRQQTLRALIDWSYDHLSEYEQLLLRRLSVFAGGWTLAAAEEICAGDEIDAYAVLDLLTQLVNKSLVVVVERSHREETRYRMLETIRQYARERLLETGGGEVIRNQHLAYFVKLSEQAEPELYRSNQVVWLHRLDDELDNLRTAMEWALVKNVESGLGIAVIPFRFWVARGYFQEWGNWLRQFLDVYSTTDALYTQALVVQCFCIFRQGDFPEAIRVSNQSVQQARALGERRLESFGLALLGIITLLQGNVREGVPLLEQSLAISRELGDKITQATTLEWLSNDHNDSERAVAFIKESLKIHRELGNLAGIADALIVLARLTLWNGDFDSPGPWLEEAFSISRQLGNESPEDVALIFCGVLAYWKGEYQKAIEYLEEAISVSEKIGDYYQTLWARIRMAHVFLKQGTIQRARTLFAESIRDSQKTNFMIALVYAIEGVASLYANYGDVGRAVQLFAWTDAMREKIGDHRPPVEQHSIENDLAVIHSKFTDDDFAKLYAEGQAMTTEQAIALAAES
jgi:predicted ATPase/class 3 adenylate cyclase